MTIGQRIAQKRKESGLSQEALGERLGVSRQTVYKWESDATLPEIEKLIALAKLFAVPVGWLLGTEERSADESESQRNSTETGAELNETQLAMVKEIVAQYLAAQPKPKPRRKWPFVLALIVLVFVLLNLFQKLDFLDQRQQSIFNNISTMQSSVNSQISGISGRVEEILKAQNDLAADYGSKILGADLKENTITFSVYALPKTHYAGLAVQFSLVNGSGEPIIVEGVEGTDGKFSAELTGELTDDIELTAIFLRPDGTREMQPLDTYQDLYTASFPYFNIHDYHLFGQDLTGDDYLPDETLYVTIDEYGANKHFPGNSTVHIVESRLGIFRNRKLVQWAEPCEQPSTFHGFDEQQFFRFDDLVLNDLADDDRITIAAIVKDNYGREFVTFDVPYRVQFSPDSPAYFTYVSSVNESHDIADWDFS